MDFVCDRHLQRKRISKRDMDAYHRVYQQLALAWEYLGLQCQHAAGHRRIAGGKEGDDEMRHLDRVTVNPKQCGGRPCIRGMRIRVKDVLDMLADGATEQEILQDFPDLKAEDIRACIAYAAAYVDHPVLVTA
jgi:uncharacterized protein (DUF433 family)